MDELFDALIGLLIALVVYGTVFVVGAVALIFIGQTALIVLEFLARGFSLIGVFGPTLAWFFLGCCLGGLIGLAQGFSKTGLKTHATRAYAGVAVTVVLLLLASATKDTTAEGAESVRVIRVAPCEGRYVGPHGLCEPSSSGQQIGIRFDYVGARAGRTRLRIVWYRNGTETTRWEATVRHAQGFVWHNLETTDQGTPRPVTYEAVIYSGQSELARGRIELVSKSAKGRTQSDTFGPDMPGSSKEAVTGQEVQASPAETSAKETDVFEVEQGAAVAGVSTAQPHLERARALLAGRQYRQALAAVEQALQQEPDNAEARALREQLQGIVRILEY